MKRKEIQVKGKKRCILVKTNTFFLTPREFIMKTLNCATDSCPDTTTMESRLDAFQLENRVSNLKKQSIMIFAEIH